MLNKIFICITLKLYFKLKILEKKSKDEADSESILVSQKIKKFVFIKINIMNKSRG